MMKRYTGTSSGVLCKQARLVIGFLVIGSCSMAQQPCSIGDPGSTVGDKGCVQFTYQNSVVNYTTVRAADGNIWLQQNLGSPMVATNKTDAAAYGDLFQWGRWDDGHQLRNSIPESSLPTPNNPLGLGLGKAAFYTTSTTPRWWQDGVTTDTWSAATPSAVSSTNGCDPCKALGAGWQLPSTTQWQQLIAAEGINSPDVAFNSNLKLTVAGVRQASNTFDFTGVRGYYWTNEPSSTGGKYFYFSTAVTNATAGGFRGQGAAVRCLKLQQAVPVSFIHFTATHTGTYNKLEWQTASETNSSHYYIQASTDGRYFTTVGKVDAAGNSSTANHYMFNDNAVQNLLQKIVYYRLQQVDRNGKYSFSKVVSLLNDNNATAIKIYPNPATSTLHITANESFSNAYVCLIDATGAKVFEQNGLQDIDLQKLGNGVYYITIKTSKNLTRQKLVIAK